MKVAFRDDDTSYFTKPEEILNAYDFLEKEECVSLSVVPYTVPMHRDDVFPYGRGIAPGYYDIENNHELIAFLKKNVFVGKYDILLHGYSHQYQKDRDRWVSEMLWKPEERLMKELYEGKSKLESIFEKEISVFVAPNNDISREGIHTIEKLGMDYSGIIQLRDRDVDLLYVKNFLRRWMLRVIYKIPYPGILQYSGHKELVAYTIDSYERLVFEYEMCKKRNVPFVVYSHYWQINANPRTKEILTGIYQYVKSDGASIVSLSECFS